MDCEKIVKDNELLVWKIATRFPKTDKFDLYQAGIVGLLKALKNYKKDGKTKFSTYAYDYIFGEMYILSNNKNLKISKDLISLYRKIEEARYKIAQKINRIPSNMELSNYLGIDCYLIEEACNSMNEVLSLDNREGNTKNVYEMIPSKNQDIDTLIMIKDSLNELTDEERNIIKSRYFEDLTQLEVARKLKMTQVMVSRYEKKGINKLRNYMKA